MLVVLCACWQGYGQTAITPYPKMAPLDQYVMQRNAEIALAQSAAPDSISHDADVFVLGPACDRTWLDVLHDVPRCLPG